MLVKLTIAVSLMQQSMGTLNLVVPKGGMRGIPQLEALLPIAPPSTTPGKKRQKSAIFDHFFIIVPSNTHFASLMPLLLLLLEPTLGVR